MRTYHVKGAHLDTAQPIETTFRATDEQDARRYCSQKRIGIEHLAPANGVHGAAAPPPADTADAMAASQAQALRAEVRRLTELVDRTFNEPKSPFFTYIERRTRMAVGVGLVIGAIIFGLIGLAFAVVLGG